MSFRDVDKEIKSSIVPNNPSFFNIDFFFIYQRNQILKFILQ